MSAFEAHGEDALVEWLKQRFGSADGLTLGIGDDAAIWSVRTPTEVVLTHDQVTESVHFFPGDAPEAIGFKALARSLSDIAAMGAEPVTALVGLAIPRNRSLIDCQRLFIGMEPLLERFELTLAGGDINAGANALVIGTTVIGRCVTRPLLRSDARPGHSLFVTGPLGGSSLGKHTTFEPRIREANHLARHYEVGAMIDISDGLALDLHRLTEASGVGATVLAEAVPRSDDAHRLAGRDGRSALEHALADGEDFELLFTLPAEEARRIECDPSRWYPIYRIGGIEAEAGCRILGENGRAESLPPSGWWHQFGEKG